MSNDDAACSSSARPSDHRKQSDLRHRLNFNVWGCRRTEQRQGLLDRYLLLFWPWFVECAFQKHYHSSSLNLCDSLSLPLDVLIWTAAVLQTWAHRWQLLVTVTPLLGGAACWAYKCFRPDRYMRRRTAITVSRRLAILPYLGFVLLRSPLTASRIWQNTGGLLVLSGGIFTLTATFLFLNSWWISVAEIVVGALVLGSAAPSSCRGLLTCSHPDAGWRTAAALMDRASFNIYKTSLLREDKAHAVCCATLNTTLVLCACLAAYLVHWFERGQRLRYKGLIPPAVAAMQGHIYGLPLALVAAQALLMLLYPAMVLGWILLGAWHGLRYFPAPL